MNFITTVDEFTALTETNKPFWVFKHSTQCSRSAAAKKEFETYINNKPYIAVRVIEERPISTAIAEQSGVQHQSPQAILMKEKSVLAVLNHLEITQQHLEDAWNKNT